jgi:hypothetical protein
MWSKRSSTVIFDGEGQGVGRIGGAGESYFRRMVSVGYGLGFNGTIPSVAFTEPRVPLVEVLASGRAVIAVPSEQAAAMLMSANISI